MKQAKKRSLSVLLALAMAAASLPAAVFAQEEAPAGIVKGVTKAVREPRTISTTDELYAYRSNMDAVQEVQWDAEHSTITVTADREHMKPYQGGAGEKEYFALVMEVNQDTADVSASNGYTINDEDKRDAAAFYDGEAEGKNLIVFWLDAQQATRKFTLTAGKDQQEITVKVVNTSELKASGAKKASGHGNIQAEDEQKKVDGNLAAIQEVALSEGKLTVSAATAEMEAYKLGGAPEEAKWFPVLVSFTDKDGNGIAEDVRTAADSAYKIEEADKAEESVKAFGGEAGRDIIFWLSNKADGKTVKLVDSKTKATAEFTIRIVNTAELNLSNARVPEKLDSIPLDEKGYVENNLNAIQGISYEDGQLVILADKTAMAAYKGNAPSEKAWFPVLVSFTDKDGRGAAKDLKTAEGSGYAVNPEDISDVEAFGGVKDTDVVLWLSSESSNVKAQFVDKASEAALDVTITVAQAQEIKPAEDSKIHIENGLVTGEGLVTENPALAKTAKEVKTLFASEDVVIVGADGKALAEEALAGTGCKAVLKADGVTVAEAVIVVSGDTTGDGRIDAKDAIRVLNSLLSGEDALTGAYQAAALAEGQGAVNASSAIRILNTVLDAAAEAPAEEQPVA